MKLIAMKSVKPTRISSEHKHSSEKNVSRKSRSSVVTNMFMQRQEAVENKAHVWYRRDSMLVITVIDENIFTAWCLTLMQHIAAAY